ncbi:SUMO activating enzyme [Kwoniella heveanensis BCC8398]|uniref:Ubiquitin-like 1-activating enzyme E1A n=1 Tax=Kwoniella heveanensis BCC8398 TaxID=1296120 RepID=A0A1B9H251_9TREE|nr:SUMO activating enzyme [Kwoniella heveanensis BCC8398]
MSDPQSSAQAQMTNGQITEDEASLYDRQIRLWGVEAQNRMRSSTVLILSLRGVAHETIKNLVLAGIGRLIVADDSAVSSEDLGTGFLFREEDGAVGQNRTKAALHQISSLNPLVSLTAWESLAPFVGGSEGEIVDVLKKEKVDVIVACDLPKAQLESIDSAARKAGSMFYAAGTYGFYGYVFADLGESYEYVYTPKPTPENTSPGLAKKTLSYPSFTQALSNEKWTLPASQAAEGGSPYRGLTRNETKNAAPGVVLGLLALWEYEKKNGVLPAGGEGQVAEMQASAERLRLDLGVNGKALPAVDPHMIEHLASHATHFFPPTLAVLGGLLAQDVLRALSRKDRPIVNLLSVDSMGGVGTVGRWAMGEGKDA